MTAPVPSDIDGPAGDLIERLNKIAADLHGEHSGTSRWHPANNTQKYVIEEAATVLSAQEEQIDRLKGIINQLYVDVQAARDEAIEGSKR